MISTVLAFVVAPLALQAAPVPAPEGAETSAPIFNTFSEMPIGESTAPRCGIAFATVEGLPPAGDDRGTRWPNIAEAGGKEFFVRAMAVLIDKFELDREDIMRLVEAEMAAHSADEGAAIEAMMPACLALLETTTAS